MPANPAPRYSWTQPICLPCWGVREPDRQPITIREQYRTLDSCSFCGNDTQAGIYVREDPKAVPYPALKTDD